MQRTLTRWIQLKVPEKYKEKTRTLRRYHNDVLYTVNKYNCKYIYVAYLTSDYWGNRIGDDGVYRFYSELGATSKKGLLKMLDKLQKEINYEI